MKSFRLTPAFCGFLLISGACIIETDADDDGSTGEVLDTESGSTTSTVSGTTDEETGADSSSGDSGDSSSGESSGSSSGTTGGSAFSHCDPQPEQPLIGMDMVSFGGPDDELVSFTESLSSPAGGYLEATFSPGLARGVLQVFGSGELDIFNTNEQDPEEPVSLAILIAADTTYSLTGVQAQPAAPAEYPFDAAIDWTLTPIPDCWEPNNTMDDASEIALGHPITGYINAGQRSGDEALENDEWLDWYRFEVSEPGGLVLDMTQVPGDGLVRARFFDADGNQVGGILEPNDPESTFTDRVEVDAAETYWLEINPFIRPVREVGDLDDALIPPSWTTPYVFELSLDPR